MKNLLFKPCTFSRHFYLHDANFWWTLHITRKKRKIFFWNLRTHRLIANQTFSLNFEYKRKNVIHKKCETAFLAENVSIKIFGRVFIISSYPFFQFELIVQTCSRSIFSRKPLSIGGEINLLWHLYPNHSIFTDFEFCFQFLTIVMACLILVILFNGSFWQPNCFPMNGFFTHITFNPKF